MTQDLGRIRTTAATVRRVDYMRKIVDELRVREMTQVDIQHLLGFSPSGERKYLRELLNFGAIELSHSETVKDSRNSHYPVHYYKLCGDEEVIERLFDILGCKNARAITDKPKTRLCADPDRHFHIMSDDVHYQVRVPHKKIPAPDPVLAAFFGIGLS